MHKLTEKQNTVMELLKIEPGQTTKQLGIASAVALRLEKKGLIQREKVSRSKGGWQHKLYVKAATS